MPRRIAMLAFDGISAFHLAVPHAVFGEDWSAQGLPPCELVVCAEEPGRVRSSMGFELAAAQGLSALVEADWVIVPSWPDVEQPASPALIEALQEAHRRGRTLIGLCLGAFGLADAGLLDGRRATTHWGWAPVFARRFPRVTLDPQVLYVDHGDVVTSAGTAAGLDCCLHLLRRELGAELANRVARRLVTPPHRQGSQAQYVEQPAPANSGSDRVARTMQWCLGRLDEKLSLDRLAEHAAMSRRTFTRRFQRATGLSVVQWLTAQRLQLARRLLETGEAPVEQVAAQAGFGTALSLRLAFAKELNTTPGQYRREFGFQRVALD
ncbi:GlxA family transcriptional regulator [Azohydromonas australica]|uniref:GlxA family transcriptional regulator n=1 Tax=Azohydromonas australica TaxID=364039 RepID=UPI0003F56F12|nr:helix-turn-helix domain-containing protein [Azohydromonas australica]